MINNARPLLSIIIVTYNSGAFIRECIQSIEKYYQNPFEIIIIDNNSTDETIDQIKKLKSIIHLFPQEKNLGFSKANNIGVSHAKGELLFFLNPDTKILDSSINLLTTYLLSHEDTGIVAPKLVNLEGVPQKSVRSLPTISGALAEYFGDHKNAHEPYVPAGKDPVEVESVVGGAIMMKKEVYQKLGGFDERFFMYFEDLDLCRKVLHLGLKIIFLPTVTVKHKVGASAATNPLVSRYIRDSFYLYHGRMGGMLLNSLYQLLRGKRFLLKKMHKI